MDIGQVQIGMQVIYVPRHVVVGGSGLSHPDVERGSIKTWNRDTIFVLFDADVARHGHQATAKGCSPGDLLIDTGLAVLDWIRFAGYEFAKILGTDTLLYAAVDRNNGAAAIVYGVALDRVVNRWEYSSAAEAVSALIAWHGVGEPFGWVHHPGTGVGGRNPVKR